MIGVAQDKRGVDTFEVLRSERFDRCLRPYGREDWRDEVAVRGGEDACAGAVVFSCDVEFKHDGIVNENSEIFAKISEFFAYPLHA